MAKGKTKTNNCDQLPPQSRSLRSRKRGAEREETSWTDGQKEAGNSRADVANVVLPECTVLVTQLDQPCLAKHEDRTNVKEKEEAANGNCAEARAAEEEKRDVGDLSSNEKQLEDSAVVLGSVQSELNTNPEKDSRRTTTNQLQVCVYVPKPSIESLISAVEKQEAQRKHLGSESGQEKITSVTVDEPEAPESFSPAKKKRRIDTCDGAEKEPSRVEANSLNSKKAEQTVIVAGAAAVVEETSSPVLQYSPQCKGAEDKEPELTVSSDCPEKDDRKESEPGLPAASSCSTPTELNLPKAGPGSTPHSADPSTSLPPVNPDLQERADTSAEGACSTTLNQTVPDVPSSVEVEGAAPARLDAPQDLTMEESDGNAPGSVKAEEEVSASDAKAAEPESKAQREAVEEPEKKCNSEVLDGAVKAESVPSVDPSKPSGSGSSDYVSDSQLNVIFTEEVVREKAGSSGPSGRVEDATDLVCGLIRELSSMNRRVMAAHKEMENLRRSSRTSRSHVR